MKKLIFGLFGLLFCTFVMQAKDIDESSVPQVVRKYVEKNYPRAVDKEWKYKDKNNTFYYYKVEFEVDGREVELEIDTNGNLLTSKEELNVKEVPSFAKEYVNKNYTNATIIGFKKRTNRGVLTYDIGIAFNNRYGNIRHRNIYFDNKGNVTKY